MAGDIQLHVISSEGTEIQKIPESDQFEGHSIRLPTIFRKEKPISSEKLIQSWQNTNQVIIMMMKDAEAKEEAGGMRLKEIEVTLSVSAEGNIGFVAGKAEAGVVLKFSR